jgi:hypothetical protein
VIHQAILFIVLFLGVALYPNPRHIEAFQKRASKLLRHPWRVTAIAGLIPVLICVIFTLRSGIPVPSAHDEFAYLLAADTFSRGRLTNPAHPLWEHFETYHVIHQPTYQMKYPPAQSLFLALGQILTGEPIAGVWISLSLAAAVLAWMLRTWLGPRWAFSAALLASTHVGLLVWGNVYWGGAVALLGGALYLGGLRRWIARSRASSAMACACGIALLANSRPYEGLVLTLVSSALLLPWRRRARVQQLVAAWRTLLPAAAIVAGNFAWIGYYNYRVTGDVLTMPYQAWSRQYAAGDTIAASLTFFTETARQTRLRRTAILKSDDPSWHREDQEDPTDILQKLKHVGRFYLILPIGIPLGFALYNVTNRSIQIAAGISVVVLAVVLLENEPGMPHYLAPTACLLFVLAGKGLQVAALRPPLGLVAFKHLNAALLGTSLFLTGAFIAVGAPRHWSLQRVEVIKQLEAMQGRHVVIVQYRPEHWFSDGWVYNGADIDASRIIWARDLGPEKRREILSYYHDRVVWLLDADASPAALTRIH